MKFSRSTVLIAFLCASATLLLFLAPINLPLYELILFPCPDPRTPDVSRQLTAMKAEGLESREVTFPSLNGQDLHGIYMHRPNSRRIFLFSHGKGNNIYTQLNKGRLFCGMDADIFMYDYQGFGKSHGRTTVANTCADALAAYDFMVREGWTEGKKIIAVGQSFGSGVTGSLVQNRKVDAVVMLSGFSSLLSAGRKTLCWLNFYPDWVFPSVLKMNNRMVFSRSSLPVFIVHGTKDKVIPFSEARLLYDSVSGPKKILVFEKGHSTVGEGNLFAVALTNFLVDNGL